MRLTRREWKLCAMKLHVKLPLTLIIPKGRMGKLLYYQLWMDLLPRLAQAL